MVTMFRFALDGCRSDSTAGRRTRSGRAPGESPQKRARILRVSECAFKAKAKSGAFASAIGSGAHARRQTALQGPEHTLQPSPLHALHHPLHAQELLHQPVDILNLYPRAAGNAPAPRAVDDAGRAPLPQGHGIDDGDLAADLAVTLVSGQASFRRSGDRQLLQERAQATHLLYLLQLALEIGQVEALAPDHFAGQTLGLLLVYLPMDLLHQAHDVAHPEDARRHALGVKGLQRFRLLPNAEENDGLSGHVAYRKCRATARIAVRLGQDDPRQVERST